MNKAPIASIKTKVFNEFGCERIDDYYWLNNREDAEVIDYLEKENSYTKEFMKNTESLQSKIYNEIIGRIKQDDETVPYDLKGYKYYHRFEKGGEYPVYCRTKLKVNALEEILLDGNKMAKGFSFFHIGSWEISENNNLLAYSLDTVSRRKYNIKFKNLEKGEHLNDEIKNTSGNMCWANDNKTLFYTVRDKSLRPYKIFKHEIGNGVDKDELVYHEKDSAFNCFIYKTKSDRFIVIGSGSTTSDEYRILDANNPGGEFKIFNPRKRGLEYSIYHQGERFLIRTNLDAKNFKVMETPDDKTNIENWKEVISHDNNILVEDIDEFQDYYVVSQRENGLPKFKIVDVKNSTSKYIDFQEIDYYAISAENPEFHSDKYRFIYTSLKTPRSVFNYNLKTHKRNLLKIEEIVGDYNPDDYVTERVYATALDGVKVPVSLVYKKDLQKETSNPLLLYGYGSYGITVDSTFRSHRLSLLDRGFIFAIAHIRGGEEMGRKWYEDGKLLKKKNTFFDFIDVGEFLINENYTVKDKLFAFGGSAGGLLMGAVINMRPDLFKGVISAVPFVDVVTTMLDESIPLTTGEYDEWGNPNNEEYYNYMLSYSPYDNVESKDYPAMLVTTGIHDSQVQYWEPAKWVAKLRKLKTDNNPLLLRTNMEYGHGGASGRFEIHKETAMEYAFLLLLLKEV
ncbi:MAG: oligopeptidase B [Marinilabiliales bacterium]|nr:MAG: oligopeptidase B [Marinilabiliales bacterium]